MAWLKLTTPDGKLNTIFNSNNIVRFMPDPEYTILDCSDGSQYEVKESLEEIEAMLNKNEQPSIPEAVAKDSGRDYIGVGQKLSFDEVYKRQHPELFEGKK